MIIRLARHSCFQSDEIAAQFVGEKLRRQHSPQLARGLSGPLWHFWRPQMNNETVVVRTNEQADPSLIVFGRDGAGKPRASWFDDESAELASKAAKLMRMHALKVETDEQKEVARELAPGRVFASGRAFTPFARASVFSKLVELARGGNG